MLALEWRFLISVSVFALASVVQHDCHAYLASLKQYSLPSHPYFASVLCPHYLMECTIYLSMAFAGAPRGQAVNATLLAATFFVAANLGVTADSTRRWYVGKFGAEKVGRRWRMIPWLY